MNSKLQSFLDSLKAEAVPTEMHPFLAALWHGLRGEWNRAHDIVGDDDATDAAWIHAWLHREEGDLGNAAYWYKRAKRPVEKEASFEDEGATIANYLLNKSENQK